MYDDGDTEAAVPSDRLRVVGAGVRASAAGAATTAEFAVGARVEARYGGEAEWFAGTITAIMDGTYDIVYEDGDTEEGVPPELVRMVPAGAARLDETGPA